MDWVEATDRTLKQKQATFNYFPMMSFFYKTHQLICSRRIATNYTYQLLDEDGGLIGRSSSVIRYKASRAEVAVISKYLLTVEDRRFFLHNGYDAKGIARAVVKNFLYGRYKEGGSTITQQLARGLFLTPRKTLVRKLTELYFSILIESRYTKEEILRMYCDNVYMGRGVYGFSGASRTIYNRTLTELTPSEVLSLVGLLRAPERSHPSRSPEFFVQNSKRLARQFEIPELTLRLDQNHEAIGVAQPRLAQLVCDELRSHSIERNDLRAVTTTIDQQVQVVLSRLCKEASLEQSGIEVMAAVISVADSSLLAESYFSNGKPSEFSGVSRGRVQAGSTFKPFAIIAALESGIDMHARFLSAPFRSSDKKLGDWRVCNFSGKYRGELSLNDALTYSDNTVFCRLLESLELEKVYDVYRRFGLCSGPISPAIVLGATSEGVSLSALAAAYACIAREGVFLPTTACRYALIGKDSVLTVPANHPLKIIAKEHALKINQALLASGKTVGAGKTGTTNGAVLFAGYTSELSVAIWVGSSSASTLQRGQAKGHRARRLFSDLERALRVKGSLGMMI